MIDEYDEINAELTGCSAPDDGPELDSLPPEEKKTGGAQNQSINLRRLCKRRRETVALGGGWRAVESCSAQMFSC